MTTTRQSHRPVVAGAALAALLISLVGCATSTPENTAAAPGTTTTAVAPAAGAAPSTSARIVAWNNAGGATVISTLSDDLGQVGQAGSQIDTAGLNAACSTLQTDVESAQAYAPLPDAEAQSHWGAALAWYARSASDCISGTSLMNAGLITEGATEMTNGTGELNLTSDRINALNTGGV